ncbi:hypothetical protein QQ045_033036 [Rhodiola kirilowii]
MVTRAADVDLLVCDNPEDSFVPDSQALVVGRLSPSNIKMDDPLAKMRPSRRPRPLSWSSIRGVGNKSTTSHLKALCVLHKPSIVAILELKISHDRLSALCSEIDMDHYMHGDCDVAVREQLWDDLIAALDSINEPWIVTGDFNVISNWSKKMGGNSFDDGPLVAFNEFLLQASLSDGGFKGTPFTWSNNQSGLGRIWERLDRSLLNGLAMSEFPMFQVTHMERIFSDHCPLLVDLSSVQHNSTLFHYQKVWETHPSFHDTVSSCWEGRMHPDPLVNFGVKTQKTTMGVLDTRLQRGWNSELANEVTLCKGQYQELADLHQDMLKAKAWLNYLEHGDHNSKIFHVALKARRVKNTFHLELPNGTFTDDREVIGNDAVTFYTDLFGGPTAPPPNDIFGIFHPVRTLWARCSKARFWFGESGSGLWNAFSHLVPAILDNYVWSLCRGDTSVETYCWRVRVDPPDWIKSLSVMEVFSQLVLLDELSSVLPAREAQLLIHYSPSFGKDQCLWTGNGRQGFSVRHFWQYGQTKHPTRPGAKHLWQRWLPPKISCFVWKVFHRILPVDDAISRLGIPLAFRCVCCRNPYQESLAHIFFEGDMGIDLWRWLGLRFNKPRVHGTKGLAHACLNRKPRGFMECLALGLAYCGLWKLWKARNSLIYKGNARDWQRHLHARAWNLMRLIPLKVSWMQNASNCWAYTV